jgi:hypothetical protein
MPKPFEKEDAHLEKVSKEPNPGEPPKRPENTPTHLMIGAVAVFLLLFICVCIAMFSAAGEKKPTNSGPTEAELRRFAEILVESERSKAQESRRWTEDAGTFSIVFPEGWEVKPSNVDGTVVKAVHRDAQDRLVMMSVNLSDAPTVDLWEIEPMQMYELLRAGAKNVSFAGYGKERIGGHKAVWCKMKSTLPFEMTAKLYLFSHRDRLYRFGTSVRSLDEGVFTAFRPLFEKAIGSIRIPAK